ncbi:3D domain-containing protein [Sporosarcina trichiuri]|uniref:3D domain-containing protein n=1 Tax=Sporosarcina trichiuri TaxID=3056445 RepID=UPI0025B581D6|nr:3D domain-containing protein [Sporosarcina sp. 0.2-SM1T-5]WJY27618.1 3D domain-containing protein [Sporosarcina sp. 0.2-SM1T-5]
MKTIFQLVTFAAAMSLFAATASAEPLDFRGGPKTGEQTEQLAHLFKTAAGTGQQVGQTAAEIEKPALTYTVKAGDTLFAIAAAHKVPLDSLVAWNALTSDLIHPGDTLNVARSAPGSATNEARMTTAAVKAATIEPKQTIAISGKTETAQPAAAPPSDAASVPVSAPSGRELTVTATAYTAYCAGCSGTTRTGIDLRANPGLKVIAVDPSVIPLGSKVWVEGYGEAIAGDTGGAIKGQKIDVFIPSQSSAVAWGVKKVRVKVLN